MLNRIFLRYIAISLIIFSAIIFHAETANAQHPCDNFPVVTCIVPPLTAWTINDDLSISTGQTNEPVAHTFYTTAQNPLTTNWYSWTAPQNGIVIVDTQGTNPNALPSQYTNPYVLDTVIAAYTGTTFVNLVRVDESDDWGTLNNPPNSSCTVARMLPEAVWSSCMRFPVMAGITYHFQIDYLSAPIPNNRTFQLNLKYFVPTAANVSVGGRIVNESGRGLSRTQITLTDTSGNIRTAIANPFGYYRFENVEVGQTYIIQASGKGLQFLNNPRILIINDELQNEDFIAATDSLQKRE